ncbi:NAD(P)-binding Rossmann-fold containing protein [Glarea lozoyensis ATCC 20868]|uniref:NAD(P)-binding Rossmann-fold containing protein n=1 Tax=Glarea lozoyensis (strain ATCC 20868 / MF5171) TaxID=1116229 RepID=S3DRR6_GLAL2|nr:NAD(P)-binding Rossmann-fold containing protein [Glarea lozoyensis ATCC 20868]EPE34671.1 NAD(P)-binding Rossmann-fold containing protein [Glarea lozoyensis ATCC 20868]
MSKIGDFPLKDKIAVVTGGGSGINLCFAQLAVQKGAKVIIADLKLTPEAEKFINSEAASAIFTKCDVTRRADLENLIRVSEENYGDVPDVYIAGAGVFEPSWSNFWDDTEEDGYAALDVNVTHAIKLTRIAMRALLRKGKKGVILITASLAGYQGTFSAPLYCATKHAVIGFVRSMAELDGLEGIKVCAVAPGMVATPLWLSRPDKMTQFGYDPAHTITPERVAADMYELVTDGQYGGGTCLENSAAGTRVLGTWNIEAPKSAGTKVPQSVKDVNYRSMIEIMGREKGAKL